MQLTAKLRNRATQWSSNLKPRVLDTVAYNGSYYINISGINSVVTNSANWLLLQPQFLQPHQVSKNAGNITGADPDYVIDLSAEGLPSFPTSMSLYVDRLGNGAWERTEPVPYDPVSKVLHNMASPTDFPNQLIILNVI